MPTLFEQLTEIQEQKVGLRDREIKSGYKVYARDEGYVGTVIETVMLNPKKDRSEITLWVRGTPVIGGDFPVYGGNIERWSHTLATVQLNRTLVDVLWLVSRRFEEMETNRQYHETRAHRRAAEIIEEVNRQTFALIERVRNVRAAAIERFGTLSPEEEALIARITAAELAAIDASVEAALSGITPTRREC